MKRLIIFAALLAPLPAMAQSATDLTNLDRVVSSFTGAMIGQPGGAAQPVDRRLRLARCVAPPVIAWYGTGRDTVQVRCPDPGSWRIFVPLVQSAAGPAAAAQPAVLRGEAVNIMVAGEGFSVAQTGEALDPGVVGSWIRVRTASAQPFRARVVRPGLVSVSVGNDPLSNGPFGNGPLGNGLP